MYVQTLWLVYFREILGHEWGVRGTDEAKMGMAAANMATRIFRQCSLSNWVASACEALSHSLGD
jgi:hypothetical protein